MDPLSLYEHSDLQHFKPSNETYIFFGKRGSGKTTIRMAMQRAYERANEELQMMGSPQHFIVDLCRPGHMTACLKDFQVCILHPDIDPSSTGNRWLAPLYWKCRSGARCPASVKFSFPCEPPNCRGMLDAGERIASIKCKPAWP